MATATERVTGWLNGFEGALQAANYSGAADMFAEDSYWRDLVSFTWNIKTVEGRDEIRDMLEAQAAATNASNFSVVGEATEADGVTEAWIKFETEVSRGSGQIRMQGDKCWTLLTTMDELKGHEEKKGPTREKGVQHGAWLERKSWLEAKQEEEASLGYETQPYCVIIGGGQGGIALGARLPHARRADHHRREKPPPRRLLAQPLQVPLSPRSGLVRPSCRTSSSRTSGRSSPRKTSSATGSRCTPGSWSSTTGARPSAQSASYDEAAGHGR